jgi:hypothetical protein
MHIRGTSLFLDIDGTLLPHQDNATGACRSRTVHALEKVVYYFNEWCSKGYRIILTTGRTESMREITEAQLRSAGLFWDYLLMGIGAGERILVNDMSPKHNEPKAIAINLVRDSGFANIDDLYNDAKIKAGMPARDEKYTI